METTGEISDSTIDEELCNRLTNSIMATFTVAGVNLLVGETVLWQVQRWQAHQGEGALTNGTKRYMSDAARLGCALCRRLGLGETPAELHHPRTGTGAGRRAPDSDVIPLCPEHHRGNSGLHGLGRKRFEREYGVTEAELVAETKLEVQSLRAMQV